MKKDTGKREFLIQVKDKWCKGCAICVEFCPEGVLIMNGITVKVANPKACKGCALCELMCPDFAVTVTRKGRK